MSWTEFLTKLDARLRNTRWSWGGVRGDGAVVLRVWQDRVRVIDGVRCVMVSHTAKHADTDSPGYAERLTHLDLVRAGATCYLVMCRAKDPARQPREIAGFNRERVFVGGKVVEFEGNEYIEIADSIPAKNLLPK
ncbi:MAG: hypothetical protein IPJ33_22400 [Gammaproteobacteria bacterium]|nr:hypothetical protein [Gammaproteobacteria bacterium]